MYRGKINQGLNPEVSGQGLRQLTLPLSLRCGGAWLWAVKRFKDLKIQRFIAGKAHLNL